MIIEITDMEEALNTLHGMDGGQIPGKMIKLIVENEDYEEEDE